MPIGVLTIATGCFGMLFAGSDAGYGGSEGEPPSPNYTPYAVLVVVGAVAVVGGIVLLVHERSPEERALPAATMAPLWGLRF